MSPDTSRPLLHRPAVLVLGAGALAVSIAWGLLTLPPGPVPTHWSGSTPDGWTHRDRLLLLDLPLLAVGVTALLLGTGRLIGWSSSLSGLNVPNRSEWSRPGLRPVAMRRLRDAMAGLAGLVLLLLSTVPVTIAVAVGRDGQQLPSWSYPVQIGGFVAAVVVWLIGLLHAFESPGDAPG
jgi:hypothetical protein